MNYRKIYDAIVVNRQFNQYAGYTENHHILPRSLGGGDNVENLVALSAREHFICHKLLVKMAEPETIAYFKMCRAFLMMLVSSKTQQRITGRVFERVKEGAARMTSITQTGKNNSQYSTQWISNLDLRETKKAPSNTPLEDGWFIGRVIDWELYLTKQYKKQAKQEKKNKVNYQLTCKKCDRLFVSKVEKQYCSNACISRIAAEMHKRSVIDDNGNVYASLTDCAKALNVGISTAQYRIKIGRYQYVDK